MSASVPDSVPGTHAERPSEAVPWYALALRREAAAGSIAATDVAEVQAVLERLAADLKAPERADQVLVLRLLAGTLVQHARAFRLSSRRGLTRKSGDVRPVNVEFRSLTRLAKELLSSLEFRDGTLPTRTIEALWRDGAQDAAGASQGASAEQPTEGSTAAGACEARGSGASAGPAPAGHAWCAGCGRWARGAAGERCAECGAFDLVGYAEGRS